MQMKLTGNRCQCPTCGRYFNSLTGFDRHLVRDYGNNTRPVRCLSVRQMEAKGFSRNAAGWWITKRRSATVIAA